MVTIYVFEDAERAGRERRVRAALQKQYGDRADRYVLAKEEKGRPVLREISGSAVSGKADAVSVTDSGSWWLIAFSDGPVGIDLQRCSLRRRERQTGIFPETFGGYSEHSAQNRACGIGEDRRSGDSPMAPISEEAIRQYSRLSRRFFHPDEVQYVLGEQYKNGDRQECDDQHKYDDRNEYGDQHKSVRKNDGGLILESGHVDLNTQSTFAEDRSLAERFFLVWTAKEAYVKWTGTGIDGNFSRFSVAGNLPGKCGYYPRLLPDVQFLYPRFVEGYMLCVCVPAGTEQTVRLIYCMST